MTEQPKEGAGRPLYESAPQIPAALPARPYLVGAVVSYPLAYLYVHEIFYGNGFVGPGMAAFVVLFMLGVEAMARALHRTAARETPLWAGCWLALAAAIFLWGEQPALTGWQLLVWHLFAVWFVLARCGMLAQGFTGSLVFLDGLMGLVVLPFGQFFRRIAVLGNGLLALGRFRGKLRQMAVAALTVLVTVLLCGTAWQWLAAADAHFAALGGDLLRWWDGFWNSRSLAEYGITFVFSLPVGAWLYGLVAGSLQRDTPPCTESVFFSLLAPLRRLPTVTAWVAVGALCMLYTLFFGLQAAEWLAATPLGLTAPVAAAFAVDGFWELFRILLLDFCVLAAVRFLGRRPLPKGLAALFCLYGVAFAGLAAAKLFTYIRLFGFTPRRVVAGWFLAVLAVWAFLLLVRVFRTFPAARVGLVVLAVSFVLLSCVDMKSRIVQANVARYAAGQDAELDLEVLLDCDWQRGARDRARIITYTRWLLDAGWFPGQSVDALELLYAIDGRAGGTSQQVALDDSHTLQLTFDKSWYCTSASLTQTEKGV